MRLLGGRESSAMVIVTCITCLPDVKSGLMDGIL